MNAALLCRTVTASDGLALHLEGTGRPAALMIHGLGYASWEAQPLREALDQAQGTEFGLWSLDNRGTGRSETAEQPSSIEQAVEDAAAAITELGAPLVVIGHSMGGYIAQELAVAHPKLVSALVLVATSPGGPEATPVPPSTRVAWNQAAGLPPADYARATMPLSFRDGWTREHPLDFENLLAARLAHPTTQRVWREQFLAAERFLSVGARRSRRSTPTLVIHGDGDRVVPVANGRLLAARHKRVDYHEVADAGHLVHLEDPAIVADLVTTFITQHH